MSHSSQGNLKLRIAIGIWMFKSGTGGLQSHAEHLAKQLSKLGHDVTVVTRAYSRVPEGTEYLCFNEAEENGEVNGVKVVAIRFQPWLRPLHWFIGKLAARKSLVPIALWLFRQQAKVGNGELLKGFDVVNFVGQANGFVGYAIADAARRSNVPLVFQPTCHPFQIGDSKADLSLFRLGRRLLVHTQYEADHLRSRLPSIPIDVVGNGIVDRNDGDAARFRKMLDSQDRIILYLGRRERDKGYLLTVDAFKKLRKKRNDVCLVCMGPAGNISKIESEGILHFEFVDEQTKHDALAACDLLCVPSEGESFGLVYMEAGRYAKPVIARRLPVLQELLADGKAGYLVGTPHPERNANSLDAEELATAIKTLLVDQTLRKEIGDNCRRVSEQFVWERVVLSFERAFRAALIKPIEQQ